MIYILGFLTIVSFFILLVCTAYASVSNSYYMEFSNKCRKSSKDRLDEKRMRYYRMCYRKAKRRVYVFILLCSILTIWLLLWGIMT